MAASLKTQGLSLAKDALSGKVHPSDMRAHATSNAFDAGTGAAKTAAKTQLKIVENIPRLVVRGLQFLFGLIVVGFYGHRVAVHVGPEWVFGLFVAALSCVTAVLFTVMAPLGAVRPKLATHRLFPMDYLLFLMWIVVFGIFGGIFLKRDGDDSYEGTSTGVQRSVVWLDLFNAQLWLVSGTYGLVKKVLGGKVNSLEGKLKSMVLGRKEMKVAEDEFAMHYQQPDPVYYQGRQRVEDV